jgi:Ser-tRNA(Ala) deacylase AlaX
VTSLGIDKDIIKHIGEFEDENEFEVGQEVNSLVDEELRLLNARNHSAGHFLDLAMYRLGKTTLKPGKGYHFPKGAYVEYIGTLDKAEMVSLVGTLNKELETMLAETSDEDKMWA